MAIDAGLRPDQRAFARRNQKFLQQLPVLRAAAKEFFNRAPEPAAPGGVQVLQLVRQAAEDFDEIQALATTGFGIGAQKILRGMYERLVVAHWLRKHPEDVSRFIDWEKVQRGREASEMIKHFGENFTPDIRAMLDADVVAANPLQGQFKTKLGLNWSKRNLVEMAQDAGPHMARLLPLAYYKPMRYMHANAAGLEPLFTDDEGGTWALRLSKPRLADDALYLAHTLLLIGLSLLLECRGGVSAALDAAQLSWAEVWVHKHGPTSHEPEREKP